MSITATETSLTIPEPMDCFELQSTPQDTHDNSYTEQSPEGVQVAEAETQYPNGTKFWLIILSMSLVLVLGGLDANILATALPSITDHFDTIADIGWYLSAYRLCSASFQFLFGKLYKIFSVKTVFLISNGIFLLGSVLSAAASTSRMLVLGRAVTGLGTAGVVSGCFTLLVHILPLRKRPVYTGCLAGIESVAIIAAPLIGGILTQHLGWRWCFWINLPLGGVALAITFLFLTDVRESPSQGMSRREILRQLDLVGNMVLVPALACLFIALSWGGVKYEWSDARVVIPLVAFAILLAIFVVDQYIKQDLATIPPRIIANRNVLAGSLFISCTNSFTTILEYYLPTYFQTVHGYDPSKSGYLMAPILVGFMVALLIMGSGTSMFGYYTPFMVLASVLMPIAAGLMTTLKVSTGLAQLVLYSGLAGFAGGIGFEGPQFAVQTIFPIEDAPLALAVILFAQAFGPAVFVSVAQTIFTSRLSANLKNLAPDINVKGIEGMGFTDLRSSLGPESLDKAILGFDRSLSQTYYLAVGLACTTIVGSLLMEWRSVKHKQS